MTTDYLRAIEKIAAAMMAEINQHIEHGIVSATVRTFGALHDYVDANCYAYDLTEEMEKTYEWGEFIGDVVDRVDVWLRAGRPDDPATLHTASCRHESTPLYLGELAISNRTRTDRRATATAFFTEPNVYAPFEWREGLPALDPTTLTHPATGNDPRPTGHRDHDNPRPVPWWKDQETPLEEPAFHGSTRILRGRLVPGDTVEMMTTLTYIGDGRHHRTSYSVGVFVGDFAEPDLDGLPYFSFRDGRIDQTPQKSFAVPASEFEPAVLTAYGPFLGNARPTDDDTTDPTPASTEDNPPTT